MSADCNIRVHRIKLQFQAARPLASLFLRPKLLDFARYPEWHTSFVSLIETVNTAQSSHSLQPGDELKCEIYDTKFTAVIKVLRAERWASCSGTSFWIKYKLTRTNRRIQKHCSNGKLLRCLVWRVYTASISNQPTMEYRRPSRKQKRSQDLLAF